MNPEDYEQTMEATAIAGQVGQQAQASAAAQYYVEERERTIAEAQLECDRLLEKARHLLKQDIKKYNDDGSFDWEPIDESQRTLTTEGINRIMQTLIFYINKENLLSSFDDIIISRRMLDFSNAINDYFFEKYEYIFRTPTVQEAIAFLKENLKEKEEIRTYANEILGISVEKGQIQKELFKEIELGIVEEIKKIRHQHKKKHLVDYKLLFFEMSQMVESVHRRAFRGEERGSLRRHTNISEIIGGSPSRAAQQGGGMFKWVGR